MCTTKASNLRGVGSWLCTHNINYAIKLPDCYSGTVISFIINDFMMIATLGRIGQSEFYTNGYGPGYSQRYSDCLASEKHSLIQFKPHSRHWSASRAYLNDRTYRSEKKKTSNVHSIPHRSSLEEQRQGTLARNECFMKTAFQRWERKAIEGCETAEIFKFVVIDGEDRVARDLVYQPELLRSPGSTFSTRRE